MAYEELARRRAEIEALKSEKREAIAIIGMACKFPGGADTPEAFWQLLEKGTDAITEIPRDRWDADAYYDADPAAAGKMATRRAGFIKDGDLFDYRFFGISPKAAQLMDPQQRLLLEVAWEALEDANVAADHLYGTSAGVFVGITCFDQAMLLGKSGELHSHAGTSSALNMAAGRLSYTLGLTGPSMVVDTACSSSLVALHLACNSLRQRESHLALAGGVHYILSPEVMVSFSQARMLAPDGRCKTFDASADGYVRGEGCGVVVLKRLSEAIADRDRILGVIRGSAVNQDGASGGLTVPSGAAQEEVIRKAMQQAAVTPDEVSYVEAHGTGTSLGDPIEIEAVARSYGQGRLRDRPILIGSVKTNIGHLEPAAGVAGLIKVLLSFRNEKIPPHLHFKHPNPHISWNEISVAVARETVRWPASDRKRIAGISAFGFSGTNAHLIVEEPPRAEQPEYIRQSDYLLTLSAKTEDALLELAARYRRMLDTSPDLNIGALCSRAKTARSHFNNRIAFIVSSLTEASKQLDEFLSDRSSHALFKGETKPNLQPRIAFVFGDEPVDQESIAEFYNNQKVFRRRLDQCKEIIQELQSSAPDSDVNLFAVRYALAGMWKSWGVEPSAVTGRGRVGKLLAECFAGVITLKSALNLLLNKSATVERHAPKIGLLEVDNDSRQNEFDVWIEIGIRAASGLRWRAVLQTLADLYVRGAAINWMAVEGGVRHPQIDLPTYPFQRERCRMEADPAAFLKSNLYNIEWEEHSLELSGNERQVVDSLQTGDAWLILSDCSGSGEALADLLRKHDQRVTIAFAGDRYERIQENLYVIQATEANHYERLLDDFFAMAEDSRSRIIHLWSLDAAATDELESTTLNDAQQTGCLSLLHLTRELANRPKATAQLWTVTRGAVSAGASPEPVAVAQSPLWGFGKVIGLEHPELFRSAIDFDPSVNVIDPALLLGEVLAADAETQVAYRTGRRYVPRIARADLPDAKRIRISADVSYVITGGLGSLGLKVANWLVSEGARHIVLIGRRNNKSHSVEQAIRSMESRGARVVIVQADVADGERLSEAFNEVARNAPPLRGIVHAAGIAGYTDIDKLEPKELEEVMRPKVTGAWQLHRLTKDMELDFFICFSSISSAWGSRGQAHYAAANSFLDALAQYRMAAGLPALSINWGPWAGGGMISAEVETLLRRVGARPMVADEAIDALAYLPALGWPQAVVADIEWELFAASYEAKGRRPLLERLRVKKAPEAKEKQSDLLRQLEKLTANERTRVLTETVQSEAAKVLGLGSVHALDPEAGLFEMGMDSLMALEFRSRVEAAIAHSLPATLVFDHPTIEAVVGFLLKDVLSLTEDSTREQSIIDSGETDSRWTHEPVAIIGMGCRFPGGANSPEAYWRLLREGVDAVTEIPAERWNIDDYYDPDPDKPGRMYSRHGGFIRDVDKFDAAFFRISPREAVSIDPQQRLALEVSWEALENAGQACDALKGSRTGVFIGITMNDYAQLMRANAEANRLDGYFFTGNPLNTTAGRISYTLGLEGPSMAIDTACSSSLVSVHQACQSLRSGESDLALAGGVNLVLSPENSVAVCKTRALSPDGRCKTFAADANGFVRSEGCGIVVLKLLSRAIADGDRVLAVIRGSAVNQDGASSGFTVPNGNAQQSVIRRALGEIDPSSVSYVEAHGTGTSLGDPIEVLSLASVFGENRPATNPLLVGSVKTNIGHAESAAGIASLLKVVLGLVNQEIPPSLHFDQPSPHIPWNRLPVRVCSSLQSWDRGSKPRLAGVSAFGASGTNAHLIVEEAPRTEDYKLPSDHSLHLLTLSAKSMEALRDLAGQYRDRLIGSRESISDICFTANVGRSHFGHRLALLCSSPDEAGIEITKFLDGKSGAAISTSERDDSARPQVAFICAGEGSIFTGSGRSLYETQPAFRRAIDRCDEALRKITGQSIVDSIFDWAAVANRRDEPVYGAILFAVEVALAKLWRSWGIEPAAIFGHGAGLCAAACIAESINLEDGLRLVLHRSRLAQAAANNGAMAANAFDEYDEIARRVIFATPRIPVFSSQTGEAIRGIPDADQLRRQFQEAAGPRSVSESIPVGEFDAFIEIGPNLEGNLSKPLTEAIGALWLGSLSQGQDDRSVMLESLARLYCLGADVDWARVYEGHQHRRVSLPTYPFQRKRFWINEGKTEMELKDRPATPDATQPERREIIERSLRQQIANLLAADIEDVNVHIQFLEMGADSIVLVEAVHLIESEFGVKLNVRQFFEELSTISALATYLDQHLPAVETPLKDQSPTVEQLPSPPVSEVLLSTMPSASAAPVVSQPPVAQAAAGSENALAAVERVLTDQNRLMAQLMNQQLEILRQTLGQSTPATALTPASSSISSGTVAKTTVSPPTSNRPATVEQRQQPAMPWGHAPERHARGLAEQQHRHLDSLIARFTARTRKSKELAAAARPTLADSRATVGFRFSTKEMLYPITGTRSEGARTWDVDGNEYIDFTMGFGVHLFGHRPDFIHKAIAEEFERSLELGARSPWAGEAAQLMCELTGHDRVAFSNTGTEAVMTALRLARAATGRDLIVVFNNSYHGHSDGTLARIAKIEGELKTAPMVAGVPASVVEKVLVLDYCTEEALKVIEARGHELAAVMVEPVQSRHPSLQPQEFLLELRRITESSGTALIFDEMITGFRVHPGGAQALFGVEADLATYGKIVGGGLPIGVIGGKARFMDGIDGGMWNYGDSTFPAVDRTAFGGTFCQHPLSMAAARAVLRHLKEQGPQLQERLNHRTAEIARELNQFFSENELPIRVVYFGSLFRFEFSSNLDLLFYHLLEKGIYIWEWRSCFLSTAHSEADIARFIEAVKESIGELQEGGFLPGRIKTPMPVPQEERRVPLSEAQKQLWLAAQIDRNYSIAYNVNTTLELEGALNLPALEEAIAKAVNRHEALRTFIDATGEEQVILPTLQCRLSKQDLSDLPEGEKADVLRKWRIEESRRAFDLMKAPLFRASLIKCEDHRYILSLTAHHIISDGTTMSLLVEEIITLYTKACGGNVTVSEPVMQFSEYLRLCAKRRSSQEMAAHEAYWLAQLEEPIPVLQLPGDNARPAVATYRGGRLTLQLDGETSSSLRSLARQHGATLYMTLLSSFTLMLHRITQQSDLIVGTPVTGRPFPGSNRVLGYCTHVMPLRSRLESSVSFSDYLRGMRKTLLDAFDHQEFPFAELIARRRQRHDVVNTPLVAAVFNLEPVSPMPEPPGLNANLLDPVSSFTPFDLSLNIIDSGSTLMIDCDYSTDLFTEAMAARLLGVYETVLRAIADDPSIETARVPLLTEVERDRLLIEWNTTTADYAKAGCIHHLFEAQAARTPEAVAMIYGTKRITYRELDEASNRFANYLVEEGVGPETMVGVCLERTPWIVIGLMAILKAGGAYVPFDPSYPRQRLAFMLEDARISLVLTENALAEVLPDSKAKTIYLDDVDLKGSSVAAPQTSVQAENLAYIIYTSGSTGIPKGVAVTHRSVVELIHWSLAVFSSEHLAGVLVSTSICFDSSVFELFVPLCEGGKLILARNALDLPSLPCADEVTLINTVPSSIAELIKTGGVPSSVRVANLAGEALHRQLVDRIYELGHIECVYNLYGPSEDTTYSTFLLADKTDRREPTIGRPITNTQLYIVDANLEPLPVGVPGELYIGGEGLARGYLNRPALTSDKFIPNPFSKAAGARLYKTGDRTRYRDDGQVEFLGRIDRQIKLRGFRIELGEIESALSANPSVEEAVVVLRDGSDGNKRIIAYVVPSSQQTGLADELRRYLRERLPDHMIPSVFAMLEEMPRLPNGKVDRSGLQEPEYTRTYQPPTNEIEDEIVRIWQSVLGKDRIGIADDFYELGGNSLSATQVAVQIYKRLKRKVEVRTLFANPTIRELARRIARFEQIDYAPITPVAASRVYELSPTQRRFWIQESLASPDSKTAQPVALFFEGNLDLNSFERAFNALVESHEILRTAFLLDGKTPVQKVLEPEECGFRVEYINLSGEDNAETSIREIALRESTAPMDMATARLLRITLVKLAERKHACICSMHHIITDGWSNVVLLNEFLTIYSTYLRGAENPLPPLGVQYKDYAAWLNRLLESAQAEEMRAYWLAQLDGYATADWEFPADFDRSSARAYQRRIHRLVIDNTQVLNLERLCQERGATLFMGLLGCIKLMLYRYTGSENITIGTPVAGRIHPDLENQIGPYLNVLPLRDTVRGDDRFVELLERIRETTLDAYANQLYPFDFLMADLGLKRDSGRNPIFDVGFTLQNQNAMAMQGETAGLRMTQIPDIDIETDNPEALTDFWFVADQCEAGIEVMIVYNGSLFKPETVERLAEDLTVVVQTVTRDPEVVISDIRFSSQPAPLTRKVSIDIAFSR